MFKSTKRVFAAVLAAAMVLGASVSALAAKSRVDGNPVGTNKSTNRKNTVTSFYKGTATLKKCKKTNAKYITTYNTVTVTEGKNKKTFKVNKVAANAFENAKNAKTINLNTNVATIKAKAFSSNSKLNKVRITYTGSLKVVLSKDAFKGLKAAQLKKMKVEISKKVKNFNALQKKLVKMGLQKKNIKKVSSWSASVKKALKSHN